MSVREFALLSLVCLIWGFHFIVLKVVSDDVPPLFYNAIRMGLVAVLLSPFLRWRPRELGKLVAAGACLGAFNFALVFIGLSYATAAAASVAVELYTPFATVLAIFFLGEKVGWRRGLGVTLAFAGVVVIALQEQGGEGAGASFGVALVAGGALFEATGSIILKRINDMRAIEISAIVALVGAVLLTVATAVFETGQLAALRSANRDAILGAVVYSALGASVIGHTSYYWLLRRLPVSIVAPSALLMTVIAVSASIVILKEPLTTRLVVGALMTLVGVGIILVRSGGVAPASGARGFFFFRRGFRTIMNGRRLIGRREGRKEKMLEPAQAPVPAEHA